MTRFEELRVETNQLRVQKADLEYTVEGMKTEIRSLTEQLATCRELREYERADIVKLRAALMRVDGINDNPACFNVEIDEVLRTVGMSR